MKRSGSGVWGVALAGGLLAVGPGHAAGQVEDFSSNPLDQGWAVAGDASLFRWDPAGGRLGVTWDSRRPNSYFHRRLPFALHRADDFSFGFELELTSHQAGSQPEKPGTFQIAVGFINVATATAPEFQRGVFLRSANLVEWTWFGGAGGISPSVSPVIVPEDGRLPWGYRDSFVGLAAGVRYGFTLQYTAAERALRVFLTEDGGPVQELSPVTLPADFRDFRVDALSVSSYSDAGQDPRFAGSVLATGWIDRVSWSLPAVPQPAVRIVGANPGRLAVPTERGWSYGLEVSNDLTTWNPLGQAVAGTGGEMELFDVRRALFPLQFYRVRVSRP